LNRTSSVPVVASYYATFLKPEMLHIYRQITSLRRVRPVVVAQKRENEERFPFQDIRVVKKPACIFCGAFGSNKLLIGRGKFPVVKLLKLSARSLKATHSYCTFILDTSLFCCGR